MKHIIAMVAVVFVFVMWFVYIYTKNPIAQALLGGGIGWICGGYFFDALTHYRVEKRIKEIEKLIGREVGNEK